MESILIKNGKVMDGTGAPWFKGDIYVQDGVIQEIGTICKEADIVIDACGKAVAPGFIDAHSHSDDKTLVYNDAESKIIQGVTTEVAGMCGDSPAPLKKFKDEWLDRSFLKKIMNQVPWSSFKEWADYMNSKGLASDMVLPVGHGTIRCSAMGFADRKPRAGELEEMKSLLREAWNRGPWACPPGLFTLPGYSATQMNWWSFAR